MKGKCFEIIWCWFEPKLNTLSTGPAHVYPGTPVLLISVTNQRHVHDTGSSELQQSSRVWPAMRHKCTWEADPLFVSLSCHRDLYFSIVWHTLQKRIGSCDVHWKQMNDAYGTYTVSVVDRCVFFADHISYKIIVVCYVLTERNEFFAVRRRTRNCRRRCARQNVGPAVYIASASGLFPTSIQQVQREITAEE